MQKIVILKGLPGSGKTTWAKDYCLKHPYTIRISRDDIRAMLHPNFRHGSQMEKLVSDIEYQSLYYAFKDNYDIILDATNFRVTPQSLLGALSVTWDEDPLNASAFEAMEDFTIEEKFFDLDIKTCIQRDQQREKPVGKEVIMRMYNKYLKNKINETT